MTNADNPARVFFGKELRRKRDEARLTGKELADALGCTPQWISTMESGRKISEQSAHDLDTFFKTDGHFYRLWKLAQEIELQTALPPGFPEFVEREKRAATARIYSALVISGLFQTEDYARAVLNAIEGEKTPDLLAKRMERQAILTRDNPPRVWLTIDEVAIRRMVGGREVMRPQLAHLLEAGERNNIMLNVVPQNVGYHAGLEGSFTILNFDDGSTTAYIESTGEGLLVEQSARVQDKVVRWDLLRGYALPVEESKAMIRTLLESL